MPKKVLVALPPGLLEQIDYVAQAEHRTRSDLIREALRRYIEQYRRSQHRPLKEKKPHVVRDDEVKRSVALLPG